MARVVRRAVVVQALAVVWTHRWRLRKKHGERFGQRCRIVAQHYRLGFHATFGLWWQRVTFEFADGARIEAQRTAARPIRDRLALDLDRPRAMIVSKPIKGRK